MGEEPGVRVRRESEREKEGLEESFKMRGTDGRVSVIFCFAACPSVLRLLHLFLVFVFLKGFIFSYFSFIFFRSFLALYFLLFLRTTLQTIVPKRSMILIKTT